MNGVFWAWILLFPPLKPLPPPYAAGFLNARPDYYDGRSWPPRQPWYYLPRPILEPAPSRE